MKGLVHFSVWLLVVACSGCSHSGAESASATSPTSTQAAPTSQDDDVAVVGRTSQTGAQSAMTVPTSSSGGSGPTAPIAGSSAPPNVGVAGGDSSAAGESGSTANASGSSGAGAGGSGAAGADGQASQTMAPFAMDPIIPPVQGDCPDFSTGAATIMGAQVVFHVGPKTDRHGSLVFYWHGTGSSLAEIDLMFSAKGRADIMKDGGLIVGFASSTRTGGDCSGTGEHAIDDFKVADQIAACGVKNWGIDPRRIYATGCSAGGLQSGCMGIQRSQYIAAVAPNSGGVTVGYGTVEDLTRMPAVMTMHGGPSDFVIVEFAQTSEAHDNYMLEKGSFVIDCNHMGGHCGAPAALQNSA